MNCPSAWSTTRSPKKSDSAPRSSTRWRTPSSRSSRRPRAEAHPLGVLRPPPDARIAILDVVASAGRESRLSETSGNAAREVLDELVHQFADPVSCFRELVQNSIDAGSSEIEVRFEFKRAPGATGIPEDDEEGTLVAEVRD